jgi:excisionase family DNA binding protein
MKNNITEWDNVPVIFDIPMAARILGVTPEGVKRRCQLGELPAFKDGKLWRFEKTAFIDYIREKSVYRIGGGLL